VQQQGRQRAQRLRQNTNTQEVSHEQEVWRSTMADTTEARRAFELALRQSEHEENENIKNEYI